MLIGMKMFWYLLQINQVSYKPEKGFTLMASITTLVKFQNLDQSFN